MTGKEPPMFDLTDQQHAVIAESGAEPIVAIDPRTRERYVLVRAEVYERIKMSACRRSGLVAADIPRGDGDLPRGLGRSADGRL
jgi:hypothetical protein